MSWIRTHPRSAATLLLVALVVMFWRLTAGDDRPTTAGPYVPPADRGTSALPSPAVPARADGAALQLGGPGAGFGLAPPGVPVTSLERHELRIEVSSESSIPGLRYYIPTSQEDQSGERSYPGTTFGLSTAVFGRPAYAAVWVKAFLKGPVTCRIYVDGELTSTETTVGRTGTAVCRG